MSRSHTVARGVVAVVLGVALATSGLVGPIGSGAAEAATKTPIMRSSRLTPAQLAGWFQANSPGGYRASVPVEFLAAYFVFEGDQEGVSGDIAFAQSVVETSWFRFPDDKQVRPEDDNFGGIGACDGGTCNVARFPTARIGVRAQIQHLRAYADPTVTSGNLAYPLVDPRFDLVVPKGRVPYWDDLGGAWASDPQYGAKILARYADMRAFAAANPDLGGVWLFSDVAAGSTFEADIIRIAIEGITRGCGDGRYCPKEPVTREQMASFLARALDLKPIDGTRFRDVTTANVHRRQINAIAQAGITKGCNPPANDRYCPKEPVTREQMASFLARALDLKPIGGTRFRDVTSANVHRRQINAIAQAGITRGCNPPTNDRYCPTREVTREQMAAFIDRALLRNPPRRAVSRTRHP